MFKLINTKTKEIAFIGKTPSQCKAYALRHRFFSVERGSTFRHIICGDWDIQKVK